MVLVDGAHQLSSRRQHLIDEDEDGLLGRQLDALADYVDELAYGEVCRDKVLLFIDSSNVRLFDLFAYHGDAILVSAVRVLC